VLLDTARHTEVAVRYQLHVGEHGQHACDREGAGDDAENLAITPKTTVNQQP